MRYRLTHGAILLTLLVFLCVGLAPSARAAIHQLEAEPFPLQPGVTVFYDTNQYHGFVDNYVTRIDIEDVWDDGVEYEIAMYGGETVTASFYQRILTDLQGCSSIDPWWGGQDSDIFKQTRCELWISRDAWLSLVYDGSALLQPDTVSRQDTGVELIYQRTDSMFVNIDGQATELPCVVARSTLNDEFWIYDDPRNPFVLRSTVQHIYSWEVTDIYVHDPVPDVNYETITGGGR